MIKTDQSVAEPKSIVRRAERMAWLITLSAFGMFCLLAAAAGLFVARWLQQPPSSVVSAEIQQPLAVRVQRAGLVKLEVLQDSATGRDDRGQLFAGDRVVVSKDATSGPATILRFGATSVALWAGTDVRLYSFGQQWNDPEAADAQLALNSGQIVIEMTGSDQTVEVDTPELRGAPVVLTSPGRYRLRILANDNPAVALAEQPTTPGLEVATERGQAKVGKATVAPGTRLLETSDRGLPQQEPKRTEWNLVRDGSFQELVNSVYGQNRGGQVFWQPNSNPTVEGAAKTGQVRPTQDCANTITRAECEQPYVRLVRMGGNTKGYVTAIKQEIEADVTPYTWVRLKADVKVVSQSLSKAGESGTECPLLIRVVYTNDQANNVQKDYCYYAFDYPQQSGVVSQLPYIETEKLTPDTWRSINIDLKQELDRLLKIKEISIQANGHDYESQVRNVQLYGEGIAEVATR